MVPKPDVSEERKSQIINAAEDVFTRKGFNEARMDDIAERTGLSKGTLYLYFPSKEDLIIAILDRLFQMEFRQMEKLDIANATAAECLDTFTDVVVRDIAYMLRLMPIAFEFISMAFRNRVVQKAFRTYFQRFAEVLIPIIQHGIDTGEFRPVDPEEAMLAIGAIMEGTVLLWVYDKSRVNPEKHIRASMRLLLEGLKANH